LEDKNYTGGHGDRLRDLSLDEGDRMASRSGCCTLVLYQERKKKLTALGVMTKEKLPVT
jgi:hypothetical protein